MTFPINNILNKNKIAIVVVGYNRLDSIARLLDSLLKANYPSGEIPLVISIDCSNETELYKYVRQFEWPFGEKHLIIHEVRLGLKDHILSCGDLTRFFKAIILLEDDLYVAPEFYNYVCASVEKYQHDERIVGISLYSSEFNDFVGFPFMPLKNGYDVYAVQTVVSWGECWTERMWCDFRKWLSHAQLTFSTYDMPERIKHWDRAWSKYFYAYILSNDKYFIIPYISLSTNFSEAGVHGNANRTLVQVNLLFGDKKFNLGNFEDLVKYDVYGNNMGLYECLDLKRENLCIDLYGNNHNINRKRYWLSIQNLPYQKIKQFALNLRPQELNVMNNIVGNDIFLYDTWQPNPVKGKKNHNILRYHLRGFKRNDLTVFIMNDWLTAIKRKIRL